MSADNKLLVKCLRKRRKCATKCPAKDTVLDDAVRANELATDVERILGDGVPSVASLYMATERADAKLLSIFLPRCEKKYTERMLGILYSTIRSPKPLNMEHVADSLRVLLDNLRMTRLAVKRSIPSLRTNDEDMSLLVLQTYFQHPRILELKKIVLDDVDTEYNAILTTTMRVCIGMGFVRAFAYLFALHQSHKTEVQALCPARDVAIDGAVHWFTIIAMRGIKENLEPFLRFVCSYVTTSEEKQELKDFMTSFKQLIAQLAPTVNRIVQQGDLDTMTNVVNSL